MTRRARLGLHNAPHGDIRYLHEILGTCSTGDTPTRTVQRTKLCRCEVSHESVVMAKKLACGEEEGKVGEKKEGSGSVKPAHYNIRRQLRAAKFRALYCFTYGCILGGWDWEGGEAAALHCPPWSTTLLCVQF
ncbi:hypothetical protein EVAR_50790_1 [Eumeta japonica]|uniref:Uncharacterized protein n=1 Tax=Eumeta variegata TaxID=151549 RepID=A0A4C1WW80_EUMVA|nr:hypothetical protein EVAR_50790_1 [Eumeta japonica]